MEKKELTDLAPATIDTIGVAEFKKRIAAGDTVRAGWAAQQILNFSGNKSIKLMVRNEFAKLIGAKYASIIQGIGEYSERFWHVYGNNAHKKIDITKDVPGFSQLAKQSINEKRGLLGYDRLHTLYQSVTNVLHLDGDILEVGVYRGGSLKFINSVLSASGQGYTLVGFDTFAGHRGVSDQDGGVHTEQMFGDTSLEEVRKYVGDDRVTLIAGDAAVTVPAYLQRCQGLRLAYLDLDLYAPTAAILPSVFEKLVAGGIILFDDYGFTSCPGVKQAVDEFFAARPVFKYHLLTGQCIIGKH